MEVRVIREEAEPEDPSADKDALLQQLAQLNSPQNLLTELKSVELSLPVEPLAQLLQQHHEKFEANIRSVIKKQQGIIKQLKTVDIDPELGRIDADTGKLLKKVDEFDELRQEASKYRLLIDMMKQTLQHIEQDFDKLADAKINQLKGKK